MTATSNIGTVLLFLFNALYFDDINEMVTFSSTLALDLPYVFIVFLTKNVCSLLYSKGVLEEF